MENEDYRHLKRGKTIAAEREQAESELERIQARKKLKRRHVTSIVMAILVTAALGLAAYTGARGMIEEVKVTPEVKVEEYVVKAQIVDEAGQDKISARTKQYIGQLEQDLAELGLLTTKVALPAGTLRELFVDIDGRKEYYKVSLDRGSGVTAEDISRMVKYLDSHDLHPEYVDVRVEGKAFYK